MFNFKRALTVQHYCFPPRKLKQIYGTERLDPTNWN